MPETTLRVRTLKVVDGGVLGPAQRERIANAVLHTGHTLPGLGELRDRVRSEYQDRGYYEAALTVAVGKVDEHEAGLPVADILVNVQAGKRYRLREITFSNNGALTTEEMRRAFAIHDGDVFRRNLIADGLEALHKAYGKLGYINFTPVPETKVDEQAGLISLRLDVDEGGQFRWGKLTVMGTETQPGARDKLFSTWQHYEGKVYDFVGLDRFLRELGARPSVRAYQVFRTSLDPNAHLVNVQIMLSEGPPPYPWR